MRAAWACWNCPCSLIRPCDHVLSQSASTRGAREQDRPGTLVCRVCENRCSINTKNQHNQLDFTGSQRWAYVLVVVTNVLFRLWIARSRTAASRAPRPLVRFRVLMMAERGSERKGALKRVGGLRRGLASTGGTVYSVHSPPARSSVLSRRAHTTPRSKLLLADATVAVGSRASCEPTPRQSSVDASMVRALPLIFLTYSTPSIPLAPSLHFAPLISSIDSRSVPNTQRSLQWHDFTARINACEQCQGSVKAKGSGQVLALILVEILPLPPP